VPRADLSVSDNRAPRCCRSGSSALQWRCHAVKRPSPVLMCMLVIHLHTPCPCLAIFRCGHRATTPAAATSVGEHVAFAVMGVAHRARGAVNVAQRTDVLAATAMVAITLHRQSPTRRGACAFRWYAGADTRASEGVTGTRNLARPFLSCPCVAGRPAGSRRAVRARQGHSHNARSVLTQRPLQQGSMCIFKLPAVV
jgi:hypothetical protein